MIPLDVALAADAQTLPELALHVRRALAEARTRLRDAERRERAAAALPPTAMTPATTRLLREQRELAEQWVALYRSALNAIDQAQRER